MPRLRQPLTTEELAFLRTWEWRGLACERQSVLSKGYLEIIRDHSTARGGAWAAEVARVALEHINCKGP